MKEEMIICPIPCASAQFVVTIDGQPYAGFVNRVSADLAAGMWTGELDGYGEPVPSFERTTRGWAAVRGRSVEVIDRSRNR